jgi:hypothetical protein
MNITELDSYNLADAVKFNDQLNPRLWDQSEHLQPDVRERLLEIADDFREFLGVTDLAIKDITVSGSNAAYTYTPNSDIDLHLVVDMPDNPVYRELFDAKKFQYNEQHDITIGGADVELYVQDADKPHISQGIYSLLNNDWIQVPRRVKSVVDDTSTRNKFEKVGRQIESAIKSGNLKRMTRLAEKIKKMRQTGLENHGEFGPENLAFKMLRSQGLIKQLYDARNRARDQELSLAEQEPRKAFVYGFKKVQEASSPDGVSPETKMFLSEEPPADDEGVLQDFVDFCAAELKLEHLPKIRLRRDPEWSVRNRTFGRYTDDQHMLEVAWGNRHIMDVLRTVAHELTHTRQHERDGDRMGPDAGETGSPYENEANARAGVLMRDYGRLHPELFDADQQGVAEGSDFFAGSKFADEDGNTFSVEKIIAFAKKNPKYFHKDFPLSKIKHDLSWWQGNKERMMNADTSFPLLVIQNDDGHLGVADGLNRMKKAVDVEKKTTIDVYLVPKKDIMKFSEKQGVAEGVPQPGPSSGAPKQFGPDAKIQTRQMTVKQIISSIPGVPYYNNVVDDWDAKDYSWGVTKKVIEYATYLKDHPESLEKLPPAIVLNGKFEDGAHRVSAIWLLQQRMDPKNPLWANAKLNVQFVKQGVAEDESNDTAISLSKLGKFHPGTDTLAEFVPERATAQYALHPDKWESTFYSLTNKDSDKLKYYGPKKISIPPGTLVGDMAIANKFYRAKTPEEQEQYAELYKASLQPYPVDVSQYRMPELLIPKQGVAEGVEQSLSSMVSQDQAERNEYAQFVKSQAGGDWTKGAKMYAQLKKRPANDIFDDASRLNQFMKMTFDFNKFTDEDWDNYWLLAQHCDDNRAFQKQALATIKKYQGTDHSHYKYLYDRISVGLTGKQKYGTQNIQEGLEEQELDEGLRSRTAAAAVVAALLGQPTGAMAQSIQGILGFIRDAGTVVQQAQNITRAGLNAEVQQEIVNYVRGVGGDAGSQNLSQLYQLQRQLQQQEPPQQDQQYRQPQNESASGYIPTKRQAKDPRYSMALTVDIKPGQVGKEANKLKLRTDRQGHPQIANPNGLVESLMMELRQFQTLDEVRMGPKDLKRFADSPEAKGIRAGFEAELVFTGIGEESYDDLEPDYGADERAYSVQQVLDFFQNDDQGIGISDRTARRVEEQLDEMYLE